MSSILLYSYSNSSSVSSTYTLSCYSSSSGNEASSEYIDFSALSAFFEVLSSTTSDFPDFSDFVYSEEESDKVDSDF